RQLFFRDTGKGKVIVLLHGYPESSAIWAEFIRVLSKEFRVIAPDLPGHGRSEVFGEAHPIGLLADAVWEILKTLKIKQCVMVGHSMGGFTTLEFARKYPGMLAGFGLFHSHPFEDSEETKKARDQFISLIRTDKMKFLKEYIDLLFWDKTRKKYQSRIRDLTTSASRMTPEALIAAMKGMKHRKDRSEVLKRSKVPVLFIVGMQDSRFPVARAWEIIRMPRRSEVLLLKDVAHMGFLEAKKETLATVQAFAGKVYGV
ncbi:MAG TPA: alpha/beta hydrolase, partial [Bacteroidales bacterium]|nr:alpha/beta hydrolase [Bacteroidales bacterium]